MKHLSADSDAGPPDRKAASVSLVVSRESMRYVGRLSSYAVPESVCSSGSTGVRIDLLVREKAQR
jgi:hypothetical protein